MQSEIDSLETKESYTILFACIHNSGRSVAAKVIAEHLAGDKAVILSGGSEPKDSINPLIKEALEKRGLSADKEYPKPLTTDSVRLADVVVTMGCGETCLVFPGKRYLDWEIEDPAGKDLVTAEKVVNDIWAKVTDLLITLGITQSANEI